jgi:hypothetical protein
MDAGVASNVIGCVVSGQKVGTKKSGVNTAKFFYSYYFLYC